MKSRSSARVLGLVVLAACGSRSGLDAELGIAPGASGNLDGGGGAGALTDAGGVLEASVSLEAGLAREIVLFGGVDPTFLPTDPAACPGEPFGDTWTFRQGSWTRQQVPGPLGRADHVMTSWGSSALLYGGISGSACNTIVYTDTWQWDGATWRELAASGPSDDGITAVVAMAELHGGVVAYAVTNDAATRTNTPSTWAWDGSAWTRMEVESPPAWYGAAMATLGDHVVWQGAGQTWSWDGAGWTHLSVASPQVSHGYLASLASQLVLFGDPVLFGDVVPSGTVLWDGSAWSPLAASGPTARANTTMAATSSVVIMFGGSQDPTTALADTWAWNGDQWLELEGQGPPPRQLAAMATFERVVAP